MPAERETNHDQRRGGRCTIVVASVLLVLAQLPAAAAQLKAIQSGEVTIFSGSTSAVVPITPVVPAKTILVFSTRTNSDDPDETQVAGNFTTGQNDELTFARNGTLGSARVYWYLAEFVSGVSVQRGSTTLTGTTTVQNIGSVDLTKSFPLISYRQPGVDWDGNDFVRATLPSATQLRLDIANAPNAPAVVEWQVVEYADAIVRTHDATLPSNQTLVGVTPGYPINASKMWLVYSYSAPDSTEKISRYMVRGFFDGGGGFSFDRYNDGVEVQISAFVVEFTDVTTVQHGTATWAIGPPLNLPVSISSSVDLTRSIAVGGYQNKGGKSNLDVNDSGISTAWAQMKLTGPTSMIVHRGRADEAAQIDWSVVEFSEPVPTSTLSGTVFEDVNYGGGAGRDLATASADAPSFTVERGNVTVELYDAAGIFLATTLTAVADGTYSFGGLTPAVYTVRVVNDTVNSSRPGSDGSELAVQTYRIDGDGESAGTGAKKVGGELPSNENAPANAGAQMLAALQGTDLDTDGVPEWTQSIVDVDMSGGSVSGVDFGFNFDIVVNTNDAGQGSLRQFILNSNLLN